MEPNKEDILARLQKENPHSIPTFKAMEEYAQEWKAKYDDLRKEYNSLLPSLSKALDGQDELKAENLNLRAQFTIVHEKRKRGAEVYRKLFLEHTALKEKAEGYERNLRDIASGKVLPALIAQQALARYNPSTESRIYIGNPAGYCHECGFPVPECNCESTSTTSKEGNHG